MSVFHTELLPLTRSSIPVKYNKPRLSLVRRLYSTRPVMCHSLGTTTMAILPVVAIC